MKRRTNQRGFSIFEFVIIVVIVAALGLVTFAVYNRQPAKPTSQKSAVQPATASNVASAPGVNSASDLAAAETTLDQTDPTASNSDDIGQLDDELTAF